MAGVSPAISREWLSPIIPVRRGIIEWRGDRILGAQKWREKGKEEEEEEEEPGRNEAHRRWKTDRATYMRVGRIFAGINFTTDKCVERIYT